MRFLLHVVVGIAALGHVFAGPGTDNPFEGRRILLIGIDGCRADALRKLMETDRAPNLRALASTGTVTWRAYAGGESGTESEQDTSSGPGWTTILTGVWRDRHGVADNRFRFHRIAQWPHWMRRIKDHAPKAWVGSLCDWPEIHTFIVAASKRADGGFLDHEFLVTDRDASGKHIDYAKCDALITDETVKLLGASDPDALFVYFGNVDETGHGVAHPQGEFSPGNAPYCAALEAVDKHIGRVVAAVKARPKYGEENWLILATTDHGGRGTKHGQQSVEERTIWMLASGGSAERGRVLNTEVPQTAIAPTVFRHLGIPSKEEWAWPQPFALR